MDKVCRNRHQIEPRNYVLMAPSWISEDGPNSYRTLNLSMYFKWTKYAEFGTELNLETIYYWHIHGFPKMDRTHTELESAPCILNGQSMPN